MLKIGIADDGVVLLNNTIREFTDRVLMERAIEEFPFTVKLNKNKPSSFVRTYFRNVAFVLSNSSLNINLHCNDEVELIGGDQYTDSDKYFNVYELEDGTYICSYLEEYSKPYVRVFKAPYRAEIFQILKLKKDSYYAGNVKILSKEQLRNLFANSAA